MPHSNLRSKGFPRLRLDLPPNFGLPSGVWAQPVSLERGDPSTHRVLSQGEDPDPMATPFHRPARSSGPPGHMGGAKLGGAPRSLPCLPGGDWSGAAGYRGPLTAAARSAAPPPARPSPARSLGAIRRRRVRTKTSAAGSRPVRWLRRGRGGHVRDPLLCCLLPGTGAQRGTSR